MLYAQGVICSMKNPMILRENKDFRRLYAKGKSVASPALVTYMLRNRVGHMRIGITTSKKIGKAVQRNRSRRVIREAYRQLNLPQQKSIDIVFVARKKTPDMKTGDLIIDMKSQIKKLGLL